MGGNWIKLHRNILKWGWYSDANTFRVFMHLLLTASYEENEFRGHKIYPGQVVFGRKRLAEDLGISERQVRVALDHLKMTNELTIKTTNKFSIATIVNWGKYQLDDVDDDQQNDQQHDQRAANKRPTNDHTQEGKKVRNKEDIYDIYSEVPSEIKDVFMEWAEMRKKIKKPLTSKRAVTMALNALTKLTEDPAEQIKLIEYAIYKNWLSFYPMDKEKPKNTFGHPEPPKYKPFEPEPLIEGEQATPEQMAEMMAKLGGCFG